MTTIDATGREWAAAWATWEKGPIAARLDEIDRDLQLDRAAVRAKLAAAGDARVDLTAVIDRDKVPAADYRRSGWHLVAAMVARGLPGFTPKPERVEGDLTIEQEEPKVVLGDLRVEGNLRVRGSLLVLGDLIVKGWHKDKYSDYSRIVIAGSMSAGDHIFSEGFLRVGGKVSAPAVILTFNQGFATILGGLSTRVFLEADHGGTRIMGPVEAIWAAWDEAVLDPPFGDSSDCRVGESSLVLRQEVSDALAKETRLMAVTERFVELLDARTPIYRSAD
jgi:hypothetical protein